jgi:uncharacterized protein (TIGR02001 family)
MKLKYGTLVLGLATAACLSGTAYAGGPGEEETEETATAAPAAVETEEVGVKLGDWIPGTFTGSVAGFSDYSFRGISQTQTDFAAQGSVIWHPWMGLYLGGWASSINLNNTDDSYLEQDWILGWNQAFGDFTLDVSATYLWYPKESDYNYWEFAAKGSYNLEFATVRLGAVYSPDYFGYADNAGYFSTGFSVPLPIPENRFATVTFDANAGYTVTEDPLFAAKNGIDTDSDYWDWNAGFVVGLSEHISVDLRYVDTDEGSYDDAGDARFIGGVIFAF